MMSAADFLFTPTVQRVLGITLTQPGRTFTLRELLRQTATGRGGAQEQIDRLVQAGVLAEEPRRGLQRSRRVRFNVYEPDEWRELVKSDPVVSQIVNGPKLQVLPHV